MSSQQSGSGQARGRPTPQRRVRVDGDPAWWRGDLVEFWVFVGLLVMILVAYAIGLVIGSEFPVGGFLAWLIVLSALVITWIVAVVVLIPRAAPEGHVTYRREGEQQSDQRPH